MSSSTSWSDLLPDLLGLVLIRLPLPADRARFRAVCRAWHSAARHHARQLPWIVFPDGSFGTMGRTMRPVDGCFYFPAGIPGLPENVTCLGAAAVGWLALDCTDDVFRRTPLWDKFSDNRFLQPRRDVKHRHSYRLYNPFTGKTVLLPELDSVIGEVAETFEIRKVLMRSPPSSDSSPDDDEPPLVAITTNSYNYNIIICRPGKGSCCVLPNIHVFDVAFHGDRLYGITPEEELVALDLAEDDKGAPVVTKCWRVIKKPLADCEEDHRSWMYDDSSDDDDGNNDGGLSDDDDDDNNGDSDGDDDDDDDDDDEILRQNGEEDSFNGDGLVPSGEDMEKVHVGEKMPYDITITTRRLVQSSRGDGDDGELLMVRHHVKSSPSIGNFTLDVDILKADMEAGNWVPVSELAKGEALFLSRSFSKSIHAYGDIKEGCIYYTDRDDVFDTKSRDCSLIRFPEQCQGADENLLTWLFPPEVQL